jgi:hypothetical protein
MDPKKAPKSQIGSEEILIERLFETTKGDVKHYKIYKISLNDETIYILEIYDKSNDSYEYAGFPSYEDALKAISDL